MQIPTTEPWICTQNKMLATTCRCGRTQPSSKKIRLDPALFQKTRLMISSGPRVSAFGGELLPRERRGRPELNHPNQESPRLKSDLKSLNRQQPQHQLLEEQHLGREEPPLLQEGRCWSQKWGLRSRQLQRWILIWRERGRPRREVNKKFWSRNSILESLSISKHRKTLTRTFSKPTLSQRPSPWETKKCLESTPNSSLWLDTREPSPNLLNSGKDWTLTWMDLPRMPSTMRIKWINSLRELTMEWSDLLSTDTSNRNS